MARNTEEGTQPDESATDDEQVRGRADEVDDQETDEFEDSEDVEDEEEEGEGSF